MSKATQDVRTKVSVRTDCALKAAALTDQVTREELVRSILDGWAIAREQFNNNRTHEATLLRSLLRSEGEDGASTGQGGA